MRIKQFETFSYFTIDKDGYTVIDNDEFIQSVDNIIRAHPLKTSAKPSIKLSPNQIISILEIIKNKNLNYKVDTIDDITYLRKPKSHTFSVSIRQMPDEWFYVNFNIAGVKFKCDQFEGLLNCLKYHL